MASRMHILEVLSKDDQMYLHFLLTTLTSMTGRIWVRIIIIRRRILRLSLGAELREALESGSESFFYPSSRSYKMMSVQMKLGFRNSKREIG